MHEIEFWGGPWCGTVIYFVDEPREGFEWSKRSDLLPSVVHKYVYNVNTKRFEHALAYVFVSSAR